MQPPLTWFSIFERSLYHAEKLHDAAARSAGALRLITNRGDLEQLTNMMGRVPGWMMGPAAGVVTLPLTGALLGCP